MQYDFTDMWTLKNKINTQKRKKLIDTENILCVGPWVGGLDGWVISDRRALENIKGSITTVKIKLGTACPDLQPCSDQK